MIAGNAWRAPFDALRGPFLLLALFFALSMLSACGSLIQDDCGPGTSNPNAANGDPCDPKAFKARRATFFDMGAQPLLANGEPERRGPTIDVAAINRSPAARASFVGYVDRLRVDYPSKPDEVSQDATQLGFAGAPAFDPGETVTVNFERASLDFFLRQMLNGALGVNYVAPTELSGTVTFRTEEPLPKAQILRVVRDVLARNGLAMRLSNGVFQIASPEVLAGMDGTTGAGRGGEIITRALSVPAGSADRVIAVVQPLLPPNVAITRGATSDKVIVRASEGDAEDVASLVRTLTDGGIAEDRVALIPLRQSAPERVAERLSEFYRSMLGANAEGLTILPLEQQQALLIGTRDRGLMRSVQRMVSQIDRELGNKPAIRIIPLTHVSAEEIAPQLQAAFAAAGGTEGNPGRRAAGREQSRQGLPAGVRIPAAPSGGGEDGMVPPGFSMQGLGASGSQPQSADSRLPVVRAGEDAGGEETGSGGALAVTELRIIPDTRNNALMVNSDYETFERLRQIVKALDVADSQVIIEATILEVRINDSLKYGVQWFLSGAGFTIRSGSSNAFSQPSGPGFGGDGTFELGNIDVGVALSALQEVTDVKVLSTPYLTVLNGKSARLVVGDQIPYATTTQSSSSGGTTTVTEQIEVVDTGVVLNVTPQIKANNSVSLTINQTVSQPQPVAANGNRNPVISTRTVESNVLVQSGRTILLGGLIQERTEDTDEGIPVLKDVPVIGGIFKSRDEGRVARTELVVLITPRVTRNSSQIEGITQLIRNQLSVR